MLRYQHLKFHHRQLNEASLKFKGCENIPELVSFTFLLFLLFVVALKPSMSQPSRDKPFRDALSQVKTPKGPFIQCEAFNSRCLWDGCLFQSIHMALEWNLKIETRSPRQEKESFPWCTGALRMEAFGSPVRYQLAGGEAFPPNHLLII